MFRGSQNRNISENLENSEIDFQWNLDQVTYIIEKGADIQISIML